MATEPREYTEDEVRERFLDQVRGMVQYWGPKGHVPVEYTCEQRLNGLAFSILVILDGGDVSLPGFIVAPHPHPNDREFCQSEGENWYPENHESDVKCDIAGSLHEHFYKERVEHG